MSINARKRLNYCADVLDDYVRSLDNYKVDPLILKEIKHVSSTIRFLFKTESALLREISNLYFILASLDEYLETYPDCEAYWVIADTMRLISDAIRVLRRYGYSSCKEI